MLEANHDAAHRNDYAPLRRFWPEGNGPVGGRNDLRSNRSSGSTVVVAVNDRLFRPQSDTRPSGAVMRLSTSFLRPSAYAAPLQDRCLNDAAHRNDYAPLRRFWPEGNGPVGGRDALGSNRSSGSIVVVAVHDRLFRPRSDTRPSGAVMRLSTSFLRPSAYAAPLQDRCLQTSFQASVRTRS